MPAHHGSAASSHEPVLAGRYVPIDRIGAGAMGTVWRAWDDTLREFVAIKVLGPHDDTMLRRFTVELSMRVRHPHIVTPRDWAADNHLVFFTMDLVRGGSLAELIAERRPLPESWVRIVLDQLLQALDAIHVAGMVHRDVKPANVFLEATGSARPCVRLGDFGVAGLINDARSVRVAETVGTDDYLAPEQIRGAEPDPRQDLYAAGVVAIQLLTCRRSGPRPAAPSGTLQALLNAMTSPEVARRPPSATTALEELHRVGVPHGAPWLADTRPPYVPDRLGEVRVPQRLSAPSRTKPRTWPAWRGCAGWSRS